MSEMIRVIQDDIIARAKLADHGWQVQSVRPDLVDLRGQYTGNGMPDFSRGGIRLAYALAYHPYHALMSYEVLKQARHLLHLSPDHEFTVVALGAGPGAEVVGLMKVLSEMDNGPRSVRLVLVDKEPGWERTRATTVDVTCRQWWKGEMSVEHVTADLADETQRSAVYERFEDTDLILAQAVLSEIRVGTESVTLLADLLTRFGARTLLVLCDFQSMSGFSNWVRETDAYETVRTVLAVQERFPMPLSSGDAAELFADVNGLRQRRQVTVTARAYARPEWRPPAFTAATDFRPTPDQADALAGFREFVEHRTSSVFILDGPAGSGKTEIMKLMVAIATEHGLNVSLWAPTGQAAVRLSTRTGFSAGTIHSGLYEESGRIDNDTKERDWPPTTVFTRRNRDMSGCVVLIDESSMIGDEVDDETEEPPELRFELGQVLSDVLKSVVGTGGQVVFVGDDCQLPPFMEEKSLALSADDLRSRGIAVDRHSLSQVERTAADSEITEITRELRERVLNKVPGIMPIVPAGDRQVTELRSKNLDEFLLQRFESGDAVALAMRNSDVAALNLNLREQLGHAGILPSAGERMVLTRGNSVMGLLNGTDLSVVRTEGPRRTITVPVRDKVTNKRKHIELQDAVLTFRLPSGETLDFRAPVVVDLLAAPQVEVVKLARLVLWVDFVIRMGAEGINAKTQEFWDRYDTDPDVNALQMSYAYARSLFRAQGGEWSSVLLEGPSLFPVRATTPRSVYSAVTRAKDALYLSAWPGNGPRWTEERLAEKPASILSRALGRRTRVRRLENKANPGLEIQITPDDDSSVRLNVYEKTDGNVTAYLQNAPADIEQAIKPELEYWQTYESARGLFVPPAVLESGFNRVESLLSAKGVDVFVNTAGQNEIEVFAFEFPRFASVRAYFKNDGNVTKTKNEKGDPDLVALLIGSLRSVWPG